MVERKDLKSYTYTRSMIIMWLPYVISYVLGYILLENLEQSVPNILTRVVLVDLFATVIVYLFSLFYRNTSIYDPYWQIITFGILLYLLKLAPSENLFRNLFILAPALIYCTKHSIYYFRFWPGLVYEDFRYVQFSQKIKNSVLYWIFSFFGLHILPTFMVLLGILPLYYSLIAQSQTDNPQNQCCICQQIMLYLGVTVSFLGVIFQTVADEQLLPYRYRKTDKIIDRGLWRYSRHPNYFGDIAFWHGFYFVVIGLGGCQYWWTYVGALVNLCTFNFYSIPAMETHLIKRRPVYGEYQKAVSRLVPWFRKGHEGDINFYNKGKIE